MIAQVSGTPVFLDVSLLKLPPPPFSRLVAVFISSCFSSDRSRCSFKSVSKEGQIAWSHWGTVNRVTSLGGNAFFNSWWTTETPVLKMVGGLTIGNSSNSDWPWLKEKKSSIAKKSQHESELQASRPTPKKKRRSIFVLDKKRIASRGLTYPTKQEKENHLQIWHFLGKGDMLVSWRVDFEALHLGSKSNHLPWSDASNDPLWGHPRTLHR